MGAGIVNHFTKDELDNAYEMEMGETDGHVLDYGETPEENGKVNKGFDSVAAKTENSKV